MSSGERQTWGWCEPDLVSNLVSDAACAEVSAPREFLCQAEEEVSVNAFSAVYGFCPKCGKPGVRRERRPDGNDTCEEGHVYPSRKATAEPLPELVERTQLEKKPVAKKSVVFKYPLVLASNQRFDMPLGAKLLDVQRQGDSFCVWAIVEQSAPMREIEFLLLGTGHDLDSEYLNTYQFQATVQDGPYVWHWFYRWRS